MSTGPRLLAVIATLAVVLAAGPIAAQRQGRPRQRAARQGAPGRANQVDPEAVRERMTQRIQQRLELSDTEWQAVQPRLQKVMELSRQIEGRRRPARGPGGQGPRAAGRDGQARRGRGPRSRPNADREEPAVQKAAEELRQVLDQTDATPEQIKSKLATLRQSRESLKQELAQARAQLQQVLTVKQEAMLVLTGILE